MENSKNFNIHVKDKKLVNKYGVKRIEGVTQFLVDTTELTELFVDLKRLMDSFKQAIFQKLMILPVKVIF